MIDSVEALIDFIDQQKSPDQVASPPPQAICLEYLDTHHTNPVAFRGKDSLLGGMGRAREFADCSDGCNFVCSGDCSW